MYIISETLKRVWLLLLLMILVLYFTVIFIYLVKLIYNENLCQQIKTEKRRKYEITVMCEVCIYLHTCYVYLCKSTV